MNPIDVLIARARSFVQNIIKGKMRPCSFCGKTQDEVKILIAGPGVFICDQCVIEFKQLLASPEPSDRVEKTAKEQDCSFCSFLSSMHLTAARKALSPKTSAIEKEMKLIRGAIATICEDCLYLCTEVLAEEGADTYHHGGILSTLVTSQRRLSPPSLAVLSLSCLDPYDLLNLSDFPVSGVSVNVIPTSAS